MSKMRGLIVLISAVALLAVCTFFKVRASENNWILGDTVYNDDFQSYDVGSIKGDGWENVHAPSNVKFTYEKEDNNKYMQINNPKNSNNSFITSKVFIKDKDKIALTSSKCDVEFDIRSSVSDGNKYFILMDSNKKQESIRMNISKGRLFLMTTGKTIIPIFKYDNENKWIHLKFIINPYAEIYDVYVNNSNKVSASTVPFSMADTIEGVPGSDKNIGDFEIRSEKGSGILDIDNIKVCSMKPTGIDGNKGKSIDELNDELKKSNNVDDNINVLTDLSEIGTKDIIPSLFMAIHDKEWYVSWEAKRALNLIAPQDDAVKNALLSVKDENNKEDSNDLKDVKVSMENGKVAVDNGIIKMEVVTEGKLFGDIVSLKKGNGENLYIDQGQYWINTGGNLGPKKNLKNSDEPKFSIVRQNNDCVELSFKIPASDSVPFVVDIRYVLRRGDSGYYYYAVLQKSPKYPHPYLGSIETKMRVNYNLFNYRIMDERLQGQLVSEDTIKKIHADEITNETYRMPDGNIWAKYDWHSYNLPTEDIGVLSKNTGVWAIFPFEDSGGTYPSFHMGDVQEHIIITDLDYPFFNGEHRMLDTERVLGPCFIYVNSGKNHTEMRVDANRKTQELKSKWPFKWMSEKSYVKSRGEVTGKLNVADGTSSKGGFVVLCNPDDNNDIRWQNGVGPYQYYTNVKEDGSFNISKVVPGTYTLYAFIDGVYGEVRKGNIIVSPDKTLDTGQITLIPKTNGKLLWQIGIPNRTGAEFKGGEDPRVYGNIDRYREFFPHDVDYTIGKSKESRDFFYVQPVLACDGARPVWKINFNMDDIPKEDAVLTLGIASSRNAVLHVKVNDTEIAELNFPYEAERGIVFRGSDFGHSYQRELRFDTSLLKKGNNTITLSTDKGGDLQYIMYDFIRLELASKIPTKTFGDISNSIYKSAIEDVASQGIMQGKTDNQFAPYDTISRAEFLKSVIKSIGLTPGRAQKSFSDIKGDEWYAGIVQAAFDKGIIDFHMAPEDKFEADNPISCIDAASIISRAYDYRMYTDMNNYIVKSKSDKNITRAEAAGMIESLIKKLPGIIR